TLLYCVIGKALTMRTASPPRGSAFFFQAEDGIRDGHVTGVQTCALPICDLLRWRRMPALSLLCKEDQTGSLGPEPNGRPSGCCPGGPLHSGCAGNVPLSSSGINSHRNLCSRKLTSL